MSGAKIDKKTIFQQGARIFYPIVLTFCSKKSCGAASGALFVCSLVLGFFRVDFYMPGFPDVYLRFGAGLQPLDVLAVGVNQQDGDDERKNHERHQVVDLRRYERKDREGTACDHRGQRHVVGDHQHQEPYAEAEQYERGVDAHDGPDERRYALAAPEIGEDREDVSHHGGEHGDETQDVEPVFIGPVGEYAVVFHQVDDRHRHKPLQKIEPEYGQCGPPAQHAQHVGRAGVLAAVFADVDAVIFLADPHGARNRAQQIGDDNHGGSGVICEDHNGFPRVCVMQI